NRNVDPKRLIDRMSNLRDYCSISDSDNLIDDRSSKHYKDESQDYEDCQLLQLTDVMIGSFRYILTSDKNEVYQKLTKPAKRIIDRYVKGYARMRNSRWFNSLCISESYLEYDRWNFNTLDFSQTDNQNSLF